MLAPWDLTIVAYADGKVLANINNQCSDFVPFHNYNTFILILTAMSLFLSSMSDYPNLKICFLTVISLCKKDWNLAVDKQIDFVCGHF